ncbi:glycogen synthase GlgA [Caldichromatium japonicum]|uniref:Glycogen synthase n=1 Tax=Caldichromatium japonicum TaxID=2699430 RepID=A0A6G7VDQ7_9GAMM|nr:glycogen synthase GlgA [Caldichromatium japonicum]QIK37927.1 glycogen synthase GlgA [Caldichromatium japonicum]
MVKKSTGARDQITQNPAKDPQTVQAADDASAPSQSRKTSTRKGEGTKRRTDPQGVELPAEPAALTPVVFRADASATPEPPADETPQATGLTESAQIEVEALASEVETTAPPNPPETSGSLEAAAPETAVSDALPAEAETEAMAEPPPPADSPPAPDPQPVLPPVWRPALFIIHVTPELASVAKVGGLGDMVFGLTRELAIRGNHVEIILPKYASLRYDQIYGLQEIYRDLWVPWYEGAIHCTVYFGFVHGRKCFFIEPHSQDNFFNRPSIYGYHDDVMRYAFFSRAAIEFMWKTNKHPDIIHCHDWQTALVPVYLYEQYQALGMTHPRVCLTIHNFAHQGLVGPELLRATGLHRPERFFSHTQLGDHRYPNTLNILKGGIVYSNFVTTVSPRYAFESKDMGQGFGLEPVLHTHHIKYGGVVNGVDYDIWNPEIDHHIPVQYGIDTLDRKYDNKRALRHRLLLADNEKAIVAFIGRLDPQKGLELVRHAIFYTLERGAQFVLLGSSPDGRINTDFWGLKRMLNDSPDCHLEIGFDEDLSHLIYAGADMILVPSRFEPCGLTQLIAMRYGTIPIVRAVGGLADTVFDKDYSSRPLHERNGYVFNDYDNPGLESALGRAIACYRDYPEHFRELMKNAMRWDYSWNRPGQDYLNIYDYIRES